jgi:hypothetical protein
VVFILLRDDREVPDRFAYHIPHLTENPLRAVGSLATAPFFNHDWDQILYSTSLLALFGLAVELQNGARLTAAAFAGSQLLAALVAGAALHLIYPEVSAAATFEDAWDRAYSGASAGALGLNGVFAAQRRWPRAVLAGFVLWELLGWWFYLRNFTPVFHLTALGAGFAGARYLWPRLRAGAGVEGG